MLRGCHNDVKNMSQFVASQGYTDILLLLDTPGAPADKMPTRVNITNGFKWLLKDAKAGDCLFIHYSGHGGQVINTNLYHRLSIYPLSKYLTLIILTQIGSR